MKKLIIAFVTILGLSTAAHSATTRYVQISTTSLTRQDGTAVIAGANISTTTVSSSTITNATVSSLGVSSMTTTLPMSGRKITGLANGTAATDGMAFGQINVGVQKTVECHSLVTFSTTSATYVSTSLTCSITPTSSSSRIRISVNALIDNLNTNISPTVSLFRGSTDLDPGTNGFVSAGTTATQPNTWPMHLDWIDSPATTSSVTYTIKIKSSTGGSQVQFGAGCVQIMILEEIQ